MDDHVNLGKASHKFLDIAVCSGEMVTNQVRTNFLSIPGQKAKNRKFYRKFHYNNERISHEICGKLSKIHPNFHF